MIDLRYEFRRFLETTDLGLQEIGDAAGVSHTTVYRWKHGISKPSEGHMRDVLELLESKHRERAEVVRKLRRGLDHKRAHA